MQTDVQMHGKGTMPFVNRAKEILHAFILMSVNSRTNVYFIFEEVIQSIRYY